jgi:hypothetical protein
MSSKLRFALFAFSLIAFPSLVFAQATPGYTIYQVNYPGAAQTIILGTNDETSARGALVGVTYLPDDDWPVHFIRYGSTYVPFSIEGTVYADPNALNNARVVAGTYRPSEDVYDWAGFAHIGHSKKHTTVATEHISAGLHTSATGINDAGDVTGYYNPDGAYGNYQGFILRGDTLTYLPVVPGWGIYPNDINNHGHVVGTTVEIETHQTFGFLYDGSQYHFIAHPESTYAWVEGVNDHGHIVGNRFVLEWGDPNSEDGKICCWRGFLLKNGVFTTINGAKDGETSVSDINNRGVIVGTFYRPGDGWKAHGFQAVPKPTKTVKR